MAGVVTTLCKRTVVSTKPIEPGKFVTPSALGRAMEHNHVRVVYYYRFPGRREPGEVTKLLKESASEMATSLPVITGRLVRDGEERWMVKCNDAGVRLVESRAKGSMQDWLRNVDREKELQLTHWEDMYHKPYFWSTFYMKVTEFEQGGVAIGLSGFHLLTDPMGITTLVKAWAYTTLHRTSPPPPAIQPSPPQPHNKPSQATSTRLINSYKSYLQNSPPPPPQTLPKQATITLKFTDEMVRASIATTTRETNRPTSTSPFEALAAVFWVSISNVRARGRLLNMSICLDARNCLGLHDESIGSSMVYNKVDNTNVTNSDLAGARRAVEEAVDEINVQGVAELMEWLESGNRDDVTSPAGNCSCHDIVCVNVGGRVVDPYSAMFQDGVAPVRVSYYLEPAVAGLGQVLVLPSPPGEGDLGRIVMVTLPEDEAVMLCKEDLILRFSPTVLMGV